MPVSGKILFVADDRNKLRALRQLLDDQDYQVLTAESGVAALDVMQQAMPVQQVVSAYRMPGMNGIELLRKVHAHWPETIRILLAGFADAQAMVAAVNQGKIFRYVPEPWDEGELLTCIRAGFEKFHIQRLLESLQRAAPQLEQEKSQLVVQARELAARLEVKDWAFNQAADIVNALPFGILVVDGQERISFCNQAAESILRQPAIGVPWQELFAENVRGGIHRALAECGQFSGAMPWGKGAIPIEGYYLRPTTRQGILLIMKPAEFSGSLPSDHG